MFKRLHFILWAIASLIPLGGWIYGRPYFAVLTSLICVVGWIVLSRALAKDPHGDVLRAFARTKAARVVLALATAELTVIAFNHERSAVAASLFVIVVTWSLWAFSQTVEALHRNTMRLMLTASSLAICLIVAELALGLREIDRPRDGRQWTWGHQVVNNRFGFRERDFQVPKPPGNYRIMVLGDSLTWGAGLAHRQRYTNRLQRRLRERMASRKIEVLNFARSGCPTTVERDILIEHIDQVQPDRVVVGFCVNDPQPNLGNYAVELEKYRVLLNAAKFVHDMGAKRVGLALYLKTDEALRTLGLVPSNVDSLERVYAKDSDEWNQFVDALSDIRNACDSRGLPPPIFAPLLYGDGDFNQPNQNLKNMVRQCNQAEEAARRVGFETVNMLEDFKAQNYQQRCVNAWDTHPSPQCNEVYARCLAAKILPTIEISGEPVANLARGGRDSRCR